MALAEQGDQHLLEHLVLADDDPAELLGHLLVDLGQALGGPQVGLVDVDDLFLGFGPRGFGIHGYLVAETGWRRDTPAGMADQSLNGSGRAQRADRSGSGSNAAGHGGGINAPPGKLTQSTTENGRVNPPEGSLSRDAAAERDTALRCRVAAKQNRGYRGSGHRISVRSAPPERP